MTSQENTDTAVAVQTKNDTTNSVQKTAPQVLTNEKGLLVGASFEDQWRICTAYLRSGLLPKSFDTIEKVLVGTQFARELGLPPLTALRQIYVLNGTPNLYGDLPLALAMRSGLIEDIEEHFIEEGGETIAATCKIKRRGVATPVERKFSKTDAQRAGLWGKGVWQKYQARMLQCRARSWALKDIAPDLFNGCSILEYDENTTVDNSGDVIEIKENSRRSSINDKFATQPLTNDSESASK